MKLVLLHMEIEGHYLCEFYLQAVQLFEGYASYFGVKCVCMVFVIMVFAGYYHRCEQSSAIKETVLEETHAIQTEIILGMGL